MMGVQEGCRQQAVWRSHRGKVASPGRRGWLGIEAGWGKERITGPGGGRVVHRSARAQGAGAPACERFRYEVLVHGLSKASAVRSKIQGS